jgi:hypothetical protein
MYERRASPLSIPSRSPIHNLNEGLFNVSQHLIGAQNASGVAMAQDHRFYSTMTNLGLAETDYFLQVGFNENLISNGTGYLEEIYVSLCTEPANITDIFDCLAELFLPFPVVILTPTTTYRAPILSENHEDEDPEEFILQRIAKDLDTITLNLSASAGNIRAHNIGGSKTGETNGSEERSSRNGGNGGKESGKGDSNSNCRDGPPGGDPPGDDGSGNPGGSGGGGNGGGGGGGGDNGPGDNGAQKLPTICFQASAVLLIGNSDKVSQKLELDGKVTMVVGVPLSFVSSQFSPQILQRFKAKDHSGESDLYSKAVVQFSKLLFQSDSSRPQSWYEQRHATIQVDSTSKFAIFDQHRPRATLASDGAIKISEGIKRTAGLALNASHMFGATISLAGEKSKATETIEHSSAITFKCFAKSGMCSWGFGVDDHLQRRHGLGLYDEKLPSVHISYSPRRTPLPAFSKLEVVSCWTWNQQKGRRPFHRNICHVVKIDIPTIITDAFHSVVEIAVQIPEAPEPIKVNKTEATHVEGNLQISSEMNKGELEAVNKKWRFW